MIDVNSVYALSNELSLIMKSAAALNKLTSKAIRPTPLPRVNLPAPKVAT